MSGGHLLALAVLLTSVAGPALATEAPEKVLTDILAHDFEGDGDFRVGQAIFTHPDRKRADDCGCKGLPRELFEAALDPIVIVSDWKLLGPAPPKGKDATFRATFRVVGVTKDQSTKNLVRRGVVPLAKPREEEITYRLRLKDGHWKLVDPPLPRVGVKSLVRLMRHEVDQNARLIRETLSIPKDSGLFRTYEWERDQLGQTEAAFGQDRK